MRKTIDIESMDQLAELTNTMLTSMEQTAKQLQGISEGFQIFSSMKFAGVGCDPLALNRPLNAIEQINQAFTYLASFRATEIFLTEYPEELPFRLNLGTAAGSDIESASGKIAAEVFASVAPNNNQKLRRDIEKVAATYALHKYVFFMCPDFEFGRQHAFERDSVQVWALAQ